MSVLPRCTILAGALWLSAGALLAQGIITDDDAVFRRTVTPFDDTPTADFVGVSAIGTQDHLFETGWWFRAAGDSREYAFPVPTTQSYVGDTSTLTWTDVAARGLFSAEEVTSVYDGGFPGVPDKGNAATAFTITNLSATDPLTIDIFHMVDFDVQPLVADDGAALVERTPSHTVIEIRDADGNFAQYHALFADSFLVRSFGSNDVAAVLSDGDVDDFDGSGLPFGPGDFTAGYQFTFTLPPAEDVLFRIQLGVNWSVQCSASDVGVLCDGFEFGDTAVWSQVVP